MTVLLLEKAMVLVEFEVEVGWVLKAWMVVQVWRS